MKTSFVSHAFEIHGIQTGFVFFGNEDKIFYSVSDGDCIAGLFIENVFYICSRCYQTIVSEYM